MTPFRNLAGLLLAAALLGPSPQAAAEVFKCKTPSGAVEFQDHPCKDAADQASSRRGGGPRCMGGDGQWYPYGDDRCSASGTQAGASAAQEQEKAEAERYLRCLAVRGKPEKLLGTVFSSFRQVCDAAPDAQKPETRPEGASIRWVFRSSYDMDIYTQGDRIIDIRKQH